MPTRVLIVTSTRVQRERLRAILRSEGNLELVGDAADGDSAVRLAASHRPHVILMDLDLSGTDALDAIRRIRGAWPDITVLAMTAYEADDALIEALRAGARGYLFTDASREAVLRTVRLAVRGELVLPPEIVERLEE
jgi:DNA-binding NarL/FixJ family response regulator